MKYWILLVFPVLALLLIGPVLWHQVVGDDPVRELDAPQLAETDHREIFFFNTEADLRLSGLLFVPGGKGPFPAVVIIHGSGTSRRDNGWYLSVAAHLQAQGVAVLLPDKRGSEQSAGDWRTASFEDLAGDTLAAIEYLQSQGDVPVAGIGVVGMSQGGHIAPLVASSTDDLAFVVNMVGSAMPMHTGLIYEENHNLRELGVLPGLSNLLAYPAAWSLIQWRQKTFWDAIGNFDPLPYWEAMDVPALVLYGEEDTNVDTAASVERLEAIGNPMIKVQTFADSGHALASPQGQGSALIRPDALLQISEFVVGAVQQSNSGFEQR